MCGRSLGGLWTGMSCHRKPLWTRFATKQQIPKTTGLGRMESGWSEGGWGETAQCQRNRTVPRETAAHGSSPGSKGPPPPGCQHRGVWPEINGVRVYVMEEQPPVG